MGAKYDALLRTKDKLRTRDGGGGSSIAPLHNDTLYVDIQYGNDGTGVRENMNLPFQTISAALLAALPGDMVYVRPGLYDEQINLRNNIDMYFSPNVVLTNTASGIVPVITDNGVAVTVSIDGDGEINSFGKQPILISNGFSNVAIKLNKIEDAVGGVQTNAVLKITAKNINIFSIGSTGAGTLDVICPNVGVNSYTGLFSLSTGDSSLYGDVINCVCFTGRLSIHGNLTLLGQVNGTGTLQVSGSCLGAIIVNIGTFILNGNMNNSLGGLTTQTGGTSIIYGNINSGIIQILRGSTLRGGGEITCVSMLSDASAGTNVVDWKGDITTSGIGLDSFTTGGGILDFTLNGNIVSGAECIRSVGTIVGTRYEVTGNLRPANGFRGFYGSGSYEFVHNDGEIEGNSATAMVEIDSTAGGIPQFILRKSRILNAGAGNTIRFVAPVVSKYIIDGTTEVSGAANSITATAPVNVRLYSTCVSDVIHDANITLLVNAAGYVVDPAVL